MGWKTINGRQYYYRSRRVGDRVESSYVGRGETAGLIALMGEEDRAGREAERAERREAETEDREVADWFARVEDVADATMLAAGYHKHNRGNWRRRRDGR